MKVFSNLSISFRLRSPKASASKRNKTDQSIYCRIYIDNQRGDFSTNQKVSNKIWCKVTERLKGSGQNVTTINHYLDSLSNEITNLYLRCRSKGVNLNLLKIKNEIFTKSNRAEGDQIVKEARGLNYVIKEYKNDLLEKKKNGLLTNGTCKGYNSSMKSLANFLQAQYGKSNNLEISDINKEFIYKFEKYLIGVKKMNKNSTHKVLKNTRMMFNSAYNNGWIASNPDFSFNVRYINPPRPLLTMDEIKSLMSIDFSAIPRLAETLDCFIFQVFSGISYNEIKSLQSTHLKSIEGRNWIVMKRKKTGNEQKLVLFPEAHKIIEKYRTHDYCIAKNQLLPVRSNQKYNEYLKEVQAIAKLETKLTSHLGRHVFATTIALSNGMPLITLSKVLGHNSIKTTQIYAKVLDNKIASDFDDLNFILASKLRGSEERT
jgi:site-specific recombinase XerD